MKLFKIVGLALMVVLAASAVQADGYVKDTSGNIARNTAGECWYPGFFNPKDATQAELIACEDGYIHHWEEQLINETSIMFTVYFDFDSTELSEQSQVDLLTVFEKENTAAIVVLVGNTDAVGSVNYNYVLGFKRARVVSEFLMQHGVSISGIASNGKTSLIDDTTGRSRLNRRVDGEGTMATVYVVKHADFILTYGK